MKRSKNHPVLLSPDGALLLFRLHSVRYISLDAPHGHCGACGERTSGVEWNPGAQLNLCPDCEQAIRDANGYALDKEFLP